MYKKWWKNLEGRRIKKIIIDKKNKITTIKFTNKTHLKVVG